jgi:hypothetical protein
MSEKQQRLVLSIIDFLDQSIKDGTIREEDKESLEIAGTSTLALALPAPHQLLKSNALERLLA